MKEIFSNLAKEIDFQEVQGPQDPRNHIPRHIIITLLKIKDKERILKAARGKERVTYKGVPIRLPDNFSKETLQAKRGWKEVFKVMKGKDLHPRSVSYTHLTLPTTGSLCRSRWSPYH